MNNLDESAGRKTELKFWNDGHAANRIRLRLPSRLNSSVADAQRLLRRYVRRDMRVLEIGFAPGKILAWLGKVLGAQVCGVDYSPAGIESASALFRALNLAADLRCEDIFRSTLEDGSFDLTYSFGVIEHFDDARPIVRRHVELLRAGGVAVIAIPNYGAGSLYGALQRHFDFDNLRIHNLEIMNRSVLSTLAPVELTSESRVFPFGRVAPGAVSWRKRWPAAVSSAWELAWNLAGLVQPLDIPLLSPWLVLEIRRK